jgi:hypothetical protein
MYYDEGNVFATIAMFGWVPLTVVFFALFPARRAVMLTYVGAWLFLPESVMNIKGLPAYTKISAAGYGFLLGVLLFDLGRLLGLRPRLYDLPIVIWWLMPCFSSMVNGFGVYDALSEVFRTGVIWLLPYLAGRMYFSSAEGMYELARGIFIGCLIYVPLCLWEVRFSPQLHRMVFGFEQTKFINQVRTGGGFRPMVFMHGGLPLTMFLGTGLILGIGLWRSTASIGFCTIAVMLFFGSMLLKTRVLILGVILVIPVYLTARIEFQWRADELVEMAESYVNRVRASSLETRISNERAIVEKVMEEKPYFGFAGWGDYRIKDEHGRDTSTVDSRWVIALGENGVIGVVLLFAVFLIPLARMMIEVPPARWIDPYVGPSAAAGVAVLIFTLDRLLNAHDNPIQVMLIGALAVMPWKFMLTQRAREQQEMAMNAIDQLPWNAPLPGSRRPRRAMPAGVRGVERPMFPPREEPGPQG